jgi:hypothetical protein
VVPDGQGGEIVMDDPEVLVWCEAVRDITLREFYRLETAFSSHAHEIYLSLPAIATACMFTGWNRDKNCLQFQVRHMSEIAIKEGRRRLGRERLPQGQPGHRAGGGEVRRRPAVGGLAEEARRPEEARGEDHHPALVSPRRDRNYQSLRADQMAVASIYIEVEQKHKIEETGFPEMPYAVPRWAKMPGEIYGNRSPGWNSWPTSSSCSSSTRT